MLRSQATQEASLYAHFLKRGAGEKECSGVELLATSAFLPMRLFTHPLSLPGVEWVLYAKNLIISFSHLFP